VTGTRVDSYSTVSLGEAKVRCRARSEALALLDRLLPLLGRD
jgi:hypothetical protein